MMLWAMAHALYVERWECGDRKWTEWASFNGRAKRYTNISRIGPRP